MINTWWATRPKRDIRGLAPILSVISASAEARKWSYPDKRVELAVESGLESAGLKRPGKRRDGGGGGARTYRAWLKSLGLIFMDDEDRLWPTLAGDAILQGEPPLPIMSKLVLSTQFPSAFSSSGQSTVASRFQVRPFIFLLQLLADPRLGGYLDETDEIAKIVICYGENNKQSCVDSVIARILAHRELGDQSLPADYVQQFRSTRMKADSFDAVVANFVAIANTLGNQLSFTQLVTIQRGGRWEIAPGAEVSVKEAISEYSAKPLLRDHDDEEKFQRRFGLPPGKHKDTRTLDPLARSITGAAIAERQILTAFLSISSSEIITSITPVIAARVATATGLPEAVVDRVLARKFPAGGIDTFMTEYAVLAFGSRDRATEFEKATASIFAEVFGYETSHIGQRGIRPDVVVSSTSDRYAGIIDAKAYGESYSASHDHRNRMIAYIKNYAAYALDKNALAFFTYVVSEFKPTIAGQLSTISDESGIQGSAITARDIIRMVERSKQKPYTHAELREIFSSGKGLTMNDLHLGTQPDP